MTMDDECPTWVPLDVGVEVIGSNNQSYTTVFFEKKRIVLAYLEKKL